MRYVYFVSWEVRMSKYSEQEWRNRAAKFLRAWRKTRSPRKAQQELGVSRRVFYSALRYSNFFQKYRDNPKYRITKRYSRTEYLWALRYAKKLKGVRLLGGECVECGEDNFFKLDFHHPNSDKESEIGDIRAQSWSKIKKEVVKCQLLCRNCHQIKHIAVDNYEKLKDVIEVLIKKL